MNQAERQQLREGYAARAARDPIFRWRYYRRLRREQRRNPSKHILLVGAPPADDLDQAIAGRPVLSPTVGERELPDGRTQRFVAVLDFNP
jgi:hypothetical protein